MIKKGPLVSVVVLNWNGKKWLGPCLTSLGKVTYSPLEIIVADNGSKDGSTDFIEKNFPNVKIIKFKKNEGFARANNLAAKKARGKYILFQNNDTTVTPTYVSKLVEGMEKDKSIGVIQPQIRSMIDKTLLDSVVSYYTSTGILYHYGYMKPVKKVEKYGQSRYGYSIKGASMMMRRNEYIYLGGFDESFITYVEESDLCHRVWLYGKKVLYYPKSVVYHWGGGDMHVMQRNEITVFRTYKNRFVSYIKNFETTELIKVLPMLFLFCEGYIVLSIFTGKFTRAFAAQYGVLIWILKLNSILKKRKQIQLKLRRIKDNQYMPFIKNDPQFSYYYHFFSNPKKYKD